MYKLGVEMEIIPRNGVSKSQILAEIRNAGIPITDEGYTHRVISSWKCVSDSSVSGRGFELVSPPMKGASNIDNQIKTICEAIKNLTRVDRTCGIHIHFEVLDKYHFKRNVNTNSESGKLQALKNKPAKLFTAKLLRNYGYFQPVIDSLVSNSRRNNFEVNGVCYCRNIPISAVMSKDQIKNFVNNKENYAHLIYGMSGRYQVINLSSLESYGTVEFRQMNGSTNATKILNWIRIMERLVSRSWDRKYAKLDCKDFNLTIDGFMDFLGFGQTHVRNYSRNRARNAGFRAVSALETRTVNTRTSEEATETGDSSNETSNNSENTELTESLLILENNYNSYHRIRNSINQYHTNELSILQLRSIIMDELINHSLPTSLNNVYGVHQRFTDLRE